MMPETERKQKLICEITDAMINQDFDKAISVLKELSKIEGKDYKTLGRKAVELYLEAIQEYQIKMIEKLW